jgi:hypothetical protein
MFVMDISNWLPELVVVMGGGVNDDGTLPPHVVERCEVVMSMQGLSEHAVVVASSSFSLNCPPRLSTIGMPMSEASAIFRWLRDHGYTGTVICEQLSHDTVGSIFFVLSLQATYLKLKRILFVTSAFHAVRTEQISEFINERVFNSRFEVRTLPVRDVGLTPGRELHEAKSLENFYSMFGEVVDAESFVRCLFLKHSNYNECFGSYSIVSGDCLY